MTNPAPIDATATVARSIARQTDLSTKAVDLLKYLIRYVFWGFAVYQGAGVLKVAAGQETILGLVLDAGVQMEVSWWAAWLIAFLSSSVAVRMRMLLVAERKLHAEPESSD